MARPYREIGDDMAAVATYLLDKAEEIRERSTSDPMAFPGANREELGRRQHQADASYSRLSAIQKRAADAAERSVRRSYGDE